MSSLPQSYVVIDVETTGFSPKSCHLIEVAAISVVRGVAVEQYDTLINPGCALPGVIAKLTGISEEMLRRDGLDPRTALGELLDFIGPAVVLGHNVGFDKSFIACAARLHHGVDFDNPTVDTMVMARRLVPKPDVVPNHKLGILAEHFSIPTPNSHRALADCFTTKALYDRLVML